MKFLRKYFIHILLFIVILVITIVSIYYNDKSKEIIIERNTIDNSVPVKDDLPTIDFNSIRKKYNNKDIKGAIRIVNEDYEKIVFQSKDNKYYQNHNYRGKKSNGEVYLDYRQNIDNTNIKLLYGNKDSIILKKYYDKKYYEKHKYLELETDECIYKYEVLSVYKGNINYDNLNIENMINNSIYIYKKELSKTNEYLIYRFKDDNNYISIISKR